jgi:hypothetical protein
MVKAHGTDREFPDPCFVATVNPGRSTKVVEELKHHNRVDLIAPAFTVDGECDIVALWQGRTTEEIMKNSFEKLNSLEGFHNHETLFVRTPFFKP